jgi:cytochrome c oxidase cbb3-type subunit 3
MRFTKTLFILLSFLFAGSYTVLAQVADAPVKQVQSSNNLLSALLIIITLIFAFVIFGMGQVLLGLIRQVLNKIKADEKAMAILSFIVLSLMSITSQAQTAVATDVVKEVPNYGGLDATGFWVLVTVIATEVLAILVLLFFIKRIQQELLPQKTKQGSVALKEWWASIDNKYFTKAVPVEKEADVMLDHDYDGIKELDNALPPWWKYGFIITIFFAVVYLLNFHVLGSGYNPTQEYEAELKNAAIQMEAYNAKNKDKIDEKNIVMADAAGVAAGKEIFTTVCWACHGKGGEGGAGPNLTDDYWIHKGSLNDIYNTLKVGYAEKGMQSWQKVYSPKQLSNIASFVKTLKGTNPPNPKAPQGDLYTDAPVVDSTKIVVGKDSLLKKVLKDSIIKKVVKDSVLKK